MLLLTSKGMPSYSSVPDRRSVAKFILLSTPKGGTAAAASARGTPFDMTDSSSTSRDDDLRCRSCSAMRVGRARGGIDADRALWMTAMSGRNGRRAGFGTTS